MRRTAIPRSALGLIGGALLGIFGTMPASAATIPTGIAGQVEALFAGAQAVEPVAHRRYDPHRHGPRFRHRRDRYRHYHGGWYYAYPWWFYAVPPVIVIPPATRPTYLNRHVQWCLNRYRSYNVRTDTFVGYDGIRRRCRSPYRP